MAEQCVIGIEDSRQQPASPHDVSDSPPHPASPLSRIESPTCATTIANSCRGDVEVNGSNGVSTPNPCTPTGVGSVTPLSSVVGCTDGAGVGGWLFSGSDIGRQHHTLLHRTDSNDSDDTESLQQQDTSRQQQEEQHLEVPAFLETPAVERMDEAELDSAGKLVIISDKLASTKPKRLSDEFFSADDNDEDDDDEDNEDDEDEHGNSGSVSLCLTSAVGTTGVDCEAQASLSEIKNLSITCDGHRTRDKEESSEESAGSAANACTDGSPLPCVEKPIASGSEDVVAVPVGHVVVDHHQLHQHNGDESDSESDVEIDESEDEDFLDDVQSMDAIERRDFEQEQRLTGRFLIRNRSLISADRLNLEFLNTINQPSQQRSSNGGAAGDEASSSSLHTDERTTEKMNDGVGSRTSEKLNSSVSKPASSASAPSCASPTSTTTKTTAQLTSTPTSSRYNHVYHHHHLHHHHHQQQHPKHSREGKLCGAGKQQQQQQVANNGAPGSDSFSSSYSRENEKNSTTKSAVHKLTRNLSASLAYCNAKSKDANAVKGADAQTASEGRALDDRCDAPEGPSENSGSTSLSNTSSVSSSVSSLASSSTYSIYASASGSSGGGGIGSVVENVTPSATEKEQQQQQQQQHNSTSLSVKGKQHHQLAEAFLKAITNNTLLAARAAETLLRDGLIVELPPEGDQLEVITNNSLLTARASETLLHAGGLIEELPADKVSLELMGKTASTASSGRSSIIAATDLLTQDENTTHDPCSTTSSSSTSYSSSSSPSPPQTQHSGDVPMVICSSELPPTASLSESTASSTSSTACGVSSESPALETGEPEEVPNDTDARLEPPCNDSSNKAKKEVESSVSLSCPFSKEDSKQGTSTSASTVRANVEDAVVTGKAGQSSQHHQHRRQYHHHHHHHHHHQRAVAGNGTSAASSSSSSAPSSSSATTGGAVSSTGSVSVAIAAQPPPELAMVVAVAVAPFHQQRDASTNTSNSPESSEPEIDEEDWADCEEGTDEEVCTCRDYTDEEGFASSEDELPSRDVDLSSYTHLDTIPEDLLHEAQTPRLHRKRKLTENRSVPAYGESGSPSTESLSYSSRKRLALDGSATGSTGTTATTTTMTGGTSSNTNGPSSGAAGLTSANGAMMATTPRSSLRSPMNNATTPTSSTLGERKTPRTIIPTKDNPPPELSEWLLQFQRWTHVERLVAVDRLIEHCEPTQVRHMMKVIEPQFQRDFISLLPKELALQVLSYLEPKDLLRAAQTCRSWRFLADDNLLWKEKCKEGGIVIEPSTDRPKRGRTGNMPPISSPWKAAYMRQHIIETNWRSREISSFMLLKGHDDHVITCLQFCGNRIVSGSDDNTLKVWSAITGKCLRTLTGHTGGVWSSQMAGSVIISGSTDRTLRVWNADTGQCMHILHGHTSTVRCMHLHGNKVVSGSRDATLRVWDVNLGTCLHMLVGHLAAVRCVQYDGKLIVSGAYDYMVKVWNPERQECLHTLQGHTNRVYSLQFDGVHVVSGSLDTSIRVWDAETGSCKHALMGHQSLTSGMELRQNILVSGNADSTVKVWDIITGQCLQTLSGPNKHQSAVTCLQFNSRFVITSSDDGTVKLWDVKTGDFIRNLVALESGGSGGVVWRIRANDTKLICAIGSRNGTEETKLMVLDFDVEGACLKCS